jgi:DNA-3-methyladenine glycosylase
VPGRSEQRRLLAGLVRPPTEAAPFLLGKILVRHLDGAVLSVRIVEVEAYLGTEDPAAHAYRGRTARTEPLWGAPGTVYVYFIYGMYFCLNIAVEPEGRPGCVLVRAAEPVGDTAHLMAMDACRGPGRLCRALDLDTRHSGRHLFDPETRLTLRDAPSPERIQVGPRVGIRQAALRPLRFLDPASPAVSRPRPLPAARRSRRRGRLSPGRDRKERP